MMDDLPCFPETTSSYYECKESIIHHLPEALFAPPLKPPQARRTRFSQHPCPTITPDLLSVAASGLIWVGYGGRLICYSSKESDLVEEGRIDIDGEIIAVDASEVGVRVGINASSDEDKGWVAWYEKNESVLKEAGRVDVRGRISSMQENKEEDATEILILLVCGQVILFQSMEDEGVLVVHNGNNQVALATCWLGRGRVAVAVERGSILVYGVVDGNAEIFKKEGIKEVESGWIGRSLRYISTEETNALLVSYIRDEADEEEAVHVLYDRNATDDGWTPGSRFPGFFMRSLASDDTNTELPSLVVVQVPGRDVILVGSSQLYEFQLLGRGLDGWETWDLDESAKVLLPMYGDSEDAHPLGLSMCVCHDQNSNVPTVWILTSGAAISSYRLHDSRYADEAQEGSDGAVASEVGGGGDGGLAKASDELRNDKESTSSGTDESVDESSESSAHGALDSPAAQSQDVDALTDSLSQNDISRDDVKEINDAACDGGTPGEQSVVSAVRYESEPPKDSARKSSERMQRTSSNLVDGTDNELSGSNVHQNSSGIQSSLMPSQALTTSGERLSTIVKPRRATSTEAVKVRGDLASKSSSLATMDDPVSQIKSLTSEMTANLGTLKLLMEDTHDAVEEGTTVIPPYVDTLRGSKLEGACSYIKCTMDVFKRRHTAADICLKNLSILASYVEELSSLLKEQGAYFSNSDIDYEDRVLDAKISAREKEISAELDALDVALRRQRQRRSSGQTMKSQKVEHVEMMQQIYSSLTLQGIRLKRVMGILSSFKSEVQLRRQEVETKVTCEDGWVSMQRLANLSIPNTHDSSPRNDHIEPRVTRNSKLAFPAELLHTLRRTAMSSGRDGIKITPGTENVMVREPKVKDLEQKLSMNGNAGMKEQPRVGTQSQSLRDPTMPKAVETLQDLPAGDAFGRRLRKHTENMLAVKRSDTVEGDGKSDKRGKVGFNEETTNNFNTSMTKSPYSDHLPGTSAARNHRSENTKAIIPVASLPPDDSDEDLSTSVAASSVKASQIPETFKNVPITDLSPNRPEDETSHAAITTMKTKDGMPVAHFPPDDSKEIEKGAQNTKPLAVEALLVSNEKPSSSRESGKAKKVEFAGLPPEESDDEIATETIDVTNLSTPAGSLLNGNFSGQKTRTPFGADSQSGFSLQLPFSNSKPSLFGSSMSDAKGPRTNVGADSIHETDGEQMSSKDTQNADDKDLRKSLATKSTLFGDVSGDKPSLFASLAAKSPSEEWTSSKPQSSPFGTEGADSKTDQAFGQGTRSSGFSSSQGLSGQSKDKSSITSGFAQESKSFGNESNSFGSGLGLEAAFRQTQSSSGTHPHSGFGEQTSSGVGHQPTSGFNSESTSGFTQQGGFGTHSASGFGKDSSFGQQSTFGTNSNSAFGQSASSGFGEQSGFGFDASKSRFGREQPTAFRQQTGGFTQQSTSGFALPTTTGFGQASSSGNTFGYSFGETTRLGQATFGNGLGGFSSSSGFGSQSSFGQQTAPASAFGGQRGFGSQGPSPFATLAAQSDEQNAFGSAPPLPAIFSKKQ